MCLDDFKNMMEARERELELKITIRLIKDFIRRKREELDKTTKS